MRFDLLDEYSTLVPFGLGTSRNGAPQDRAIPAQTPGGATRFASPPGLLRKALGALGQMVVSSCRSAARRILDARGGSLPGRGAGFRSLP